MRAMRVYESLMHQYESPIEEEGEGGRVNGRGCRDRFGGDQASCCATSFHIYILSLFRLLNE
jgi:hypothetical protein